MRELTMNDLTMRELTNEEISMVSGGWTVFGSKLILAGFVIGIIGAVVVVATGGALVGAAVGAVVATVGALGYAYNTLSQAQADLPQGVIEVGPLEYIESETSIQVEAASSYSGYMLEQQYWEQLFAIQSGG